MMNKSSNLERKEKRTSLFLGIYIIGFALLSLIFILTKVLPFQETVVFKSTIVSTTLGSENTQYLENIEVPAEVTLIWPLVFFIGGVFALIDRKANKKLQDSLFLVTFGLISFILGGTFSFYFRPPFPFNIITYFFTAIGLLILIRTSYLGVRFLVQKSFTK